MKKVIDSLTKTPVLLALVTILELAISKKIDGSLTIWALYGIYKILAP